MWKKAIGWILVFICMGIIFLFSAANSESSTAQSEGTVHKIVDIGVKIAEKIGWIDRRPSSQRVDDVVEILNSPVRKLAHLTIYFVLGFLIMLALRTNTQNWERNLLITILICFIYSLSDEYHQTLILGRSGEISDCLIDTLGSIIACLVYGVFAFIINSYKKEKKNNDL